MTFYTEINRIAELTISNGYADGTFRSDENITREQMAKFVARASGMDPEMKYGSWPQDFFPDVPADNPFRDYIRFISEPHPEAEGTDDQRNRPIVDGFSDGTFRPASLLTRAEMAKFITNALKWNDNGLSKLEDQCGYNSESDVFSWEDSDPAFFSDVDSTHRLYNFIRCTKELGIITGYQTGEYAEFRPDREISRGEAAKFLMAFADRSEITTQTENPDDDFANNTPAGATVYQEGTGARLSVPAGDVDYVAIEVAAQQRAASSGDFPLWIRSVENGPNAYIRIDVLGTNGSAVLTSTIGSPWRGGTSLRWNPPGPGTYYVRLTNTDPFASEGVNVLLGISPDYTSVGPCEVGGVIDHDTTWSRTACHPYIITSNLYVAPGVTLTVGPGVVVKAQDNYYGSLVVNVAGYLVTQGTQTEPVIFTSLRDDDNSAGDTNNDGSASRPGDDPPYHPTYTDWGGIILAHGGEWTYTEVRYAGYTLHGAVQVAQGSHFSASNSTFYHNTNGVAIVGDATDVVTVVGLMDCTLEENSGYGLQASGNGPHIVTIQNSVIARNTTGVHVSNYGAAGYLRVQNSLIEDNAQFGVRAEGSTAPDSRRIIAYVGNSQLHNNGTGFHLTGATAQLKDNSFTGNTAYAMVTESTIMPADASRNWWGESNGPKHATNNPSGSGDAVAGVFLFDPWLRAAPFFSHTTPDNPTGASQSRISIQPASVPADGITPAVITVRLLTTDGRPAWGKSVGFISNRGPIDIVVQPSAVTDSRGYAFGKIRSAEPGLASVSALVYEDGVVLAETANVNFEPATATGNPLISQIDFIVDKAKENLSYVDEDARAIAVDGSYLRGTIDSDQAKRAVNLVLGLSDISLATMKVPAVKRFLESLCPGCYVPGAANVQFAAGHPVAKRLLDGLFLKPGDIIPLPEEKLSLAYFKASFFQNAINGYVNQPLKGGARNALQYVFANQEDSMTTMAYPAVQLAVEDLSLLLNLQRNNLLANLPALPPAQQRAYADDLTKRATALQVLGQALSAERRTLANFRATRASKPDAMEQLVWRSALKAIASMVGASVIVGVNLTAFDFYMDNSDLNESQLMYAMATADLMGAPIELNRIYQTAQTGLSRIHLHYPAMVATGRINGMSHFSDGQIQGGRKRYWIEKASYSEVSLTNTGAYETTYWVRINYLADTERFGVPWVTMDQNAFATLTLAPNVTGTIRVDYKEKDGTVGLSPRSRTCISGAGCIEPSEMRLVVLGTNEAGTYYIGSNSSAWQPTPTSLNRVGIASIDAESPIVDPLVSTYVLADPENQQHKAQLWINNPMTTSVLVTLTQPVPNDIALISAPGAESVGESLSWTMQVEPSSIKAVTFTYAFSGIPGASALLPPAVATLASLDDSEVLQAASNEAPFHVLWPVAVNYDTPGYVMPGSPLSLVVTMTNRLTQSTTTGAVLITGTNQMGDIAFSETLAFSAPPGGEVAVSSAPQEALPVGYYTVKGSVIVNGGSSEFMAEVVQVGLPSPEIQFTASTLGPLHPGDRLTYTVRVTNSLDIPITNGVLTASLPTSATVDLLSVSDSGVVESNQVK